MLSYLINAFDIINFVKHFLNSTIDTQSRLLYTLLSLEKGYINFVPKSVRRPSVRAYVRLCVRAFATFLVNASPPQLLDLTTSTFVAE